MAKRLRRLRRSLLAVGLIVYAHALLAGGIALVLVAPSPIATALGAALLAALFTLTAVAAGVVMGNRLHQGDTPLPPVADLERQLSGGDPDFADDLEDQLDQLRLTNESAMPSAWGMTAPESREQ